MVSSQAIYTYNPLWRTWVVIFEAPFGCHDILILGKSTIKWRQRPDMTIAFDLDVKQTKLFELPCLVHPCKCKKFTCKVCNDRLAHDTMISDIINSTHTEKPERI